MHHIHRRRSPVRRLPLLVPVIAVLATTPATAPAAEVATATSSEAVGMRYVATSANNTVVVRLAGTTFTVDDVVPIQAGAGCAQVAGDATKVTCVAFKNGTIPSATFKQFFVDLRAGDDTVVNQTTLAGTVGAPMSVLGGTGKDRLTGANGVGDTLRGGDGDDAIAPSPLIDFLTYAPDGRADLIDCGALGRNDGDPGDIAVRMIADGDFVNDCALVIDE